ncbi:hypothetical protein [Parablautia intestinalis]|uniref:hypothetical protein n=1 Tax=Parablautia intestinalis TaxID=2320100 RepID=UPI00256EFB41|nr:hypothetical protein [Parablautia intestinalis]
MKKIFMVLVMASALFCGCGKEENSDVSEYYNEVSKAQEIAVVSADTSSVIQTITGKEGIGDFMLALDMDKWELGKLPSSIEEIGSFGLSQEETVKLGQTEADGELYDVCKISVYDTSYVKFEVTGLDMVFEISEDTADYLQGYFE